MNGWTEMARGRTNGEASYGDHCSRFLTLYGRQYDTGRKRAEWTGWYASRYCDVSRSGGISRRPQEDDQFDVADSSVRS